MTSTKSIALFKLVYFCNLSSLSPAISSVL